MKTHDLSKNSNNSDAPWKPTYKWMGVTAGIILLLLIIVFFVLNIVLKPYMRELPLSITPWLDKSKKEIKADQQSVQIKQGEQNAQAQVSAD